MAKRTRKRIACELTSGSRRYSGIVLDLSETGIFIQTTATLDPGTRVELVLNSAEPIPLQGTVARRMSVPSNLAQIAKGGVGVMLARPPGAYRALVRDITGPSSARPGVRTGERARGPAATKPRRAKEGPPPSVEKERFRVTVEQDSGAGRRAYLMECASEAEARERALGAAGPGWSVAAVERP